MRNHLTPLYAKGHLHSTEGQNMTKYSVGTKWHWPNGVGSVELMQDGMKGIKTGHPAEDII